MDENPYLGWGLRPVELADQAVLNPFFASLSEPLSDYTFSQLFTWRNSLRVLWKVIDSHLCVFANGTGDLTLLMPPIGDTAGDRALDQAFELMDEFNAVHGVPHRTRIEYASDELLARFDHAHLHIKPMGADYVYDVARMIDLAGGDLASKRQAKNRFMRNYEYRVEPYIAARHHDACAALLDAWKIHQDAQHLEEPNASAIKRSKESIATALCLDSADLLGLSGMVVSVKEGAQTRDRHSAIHQVCTPTIDGFALRAFTFGEQLGAGQSSITIEKTDLAVKGLAQFVFSEFCRENWSHLPLVNVGDDWGLETLAWTKQSYRPVKMLRKYVLRRESVATGPTGIDLSARPVEQSLSGRVAGRAVEAEVTVRAARKDDLAATLALENDAFTHHAISKRQMNYLRQRQSAIFLVAELNGEVVGDGIALVRHHGSGTSGRIYSLAVRPDCRGRKIGRRLMAALLQGLHQRGVDRIYLEVEQSNIAAVSLYEDIGFIPIGSLPDYYGPGQNGLHMMHEAAQEAHLFKGVA